MRSYASLVQPVAALLLVVAVGINLAAYLRDRSPTASVAEPVRAKPPRPMPAAAAHTPTPSPAPSATDSGYVIRRVLPIDAPLRFGDLHWDEAGVPQGPVVVTVDIGARVLSVFRAGYEIGTSAVIYGADNHPTPLGVYPILQKDRHHRSNIYDGAPMPFGLRLTRDGVFIHGSPGADARYMTHGCIGLPLPFAAKLFEAVGRGDRVIVTNGETLAQGQAIPAA